MLVSKKEILVSIYEKNKIVLIGLKIRLNDNDNLSPFFSNQNKLIIIVFLTNFKKLIRHYVPKRLLLDLI